MKTLTVFLVFALLLAFTPAASAATVQPTPVAAIVQVPEQGSGPTIPPGPWDEEDTGSGGTKVTAPLQDIDMPACFPCEGK